MGLVFYLLLKVLGSSTGIISLCAYYKTSTSSLHFFFFLSTYLTIIYCKSRMCVRRSSSSSWRKCVTKIWRIWVEKVKKLKNQKMKVSTWRRPQKKSYWNLAQKYFFDRLQKKNHFFFKFIFIFFSKLCLHFFQIFFKFIFRFFSTLFPDFFQNYFQIFFKIIFRFFQIFSDFFQNYVHIFFKIMYQIFFPIKKKKVFPIFSTF